MPSSELPPPNEDGLNNLLAALRRTRTIQDHPDWPAFRERKLPQTISFYYVNKNGQEAFWDHARIIRIDLRKLQLIVEGMHSDPLRFDIPKIMHCKDAKTGERVQDLFFELTRMWKEIHETSAPPDDEI